MAHLSGTTVIQDVAHRVDRTFAHRMTQTTVSVVGADGLPLAGVEVTVAQRSHRFLFGCIGFDFIALANGEADAASVFGGAQPELAAQIADQWFDVFNVATLPFYWGGFEPVRGKPDTARIMRAAQWFAGRGAMVKGHPLVWHTVTADWLLELSNDEIVRVLSERIRRDVTNFAGVIDMWDVINEVVIMPVFDKYDNGITRISRDLGRIGIIRMAFEEARAANPAATLLLNDFDLSTAYECLLEGVLEAGITIDALGLQSHMHQGYWGEDKTLATVERFARYGIPLHMTESTLLSGHLMPPTIEDLNDYQIPEWPSTPDGEQRQAEEMVRHYKAMLAHPSIEATTYWGLTDAGAWLGAPVGLVRADGSAKPSYDALRALVKGEWWLAPTVMRTDADGRVLVTGWLGDYDITAAGDSATVTVNTVGEATALVQLGP